MFGANQQVPHAAPAIQMRVAQAEHELAPSRPVFFLCFSASGLTALLAIIYECIQKVRRRKPLVVPKKAKPPDGSSVIVRAPNRRKASKRPSDLIGFARHRGPPRRKSKQAARVNISDLRRIAFRAGPRTPEERGTPRAWTDHAGHNAWAHRIDRCRYSILLLIVWRPTGPHQDYRDSDLVFSVRSDF
jgi:hypothetical protein